MTTLQAIQLPRDQAHHLGALRLQPGFTICEQQDSVWVRVSNLPEESENTFASLPGVRYNVAADLQLTRVDQRTPSGWLPQGDWLPLAQWLRVEIDSPGYSGKQSAKAQLQLVRSESPAEANLLLTTSACWRAYAIAAPIVRLNALSFAMTAGDQLVIRGTPLPPISGTRFIEQQGVAAPAGWIWSPQLDADVIAGVLGIETNDVALLKEDGSWDHIKADDFIQATRTAVRASTTKP